MKQTYMVTIKISDEPSEYYADVLVVADSVLEAARLARAKAKETYYAEAGGWALNPQSRFLGIEPHVMPEKGVVMVSTEFGR